MKQEVVVEQGQRMNIAVADDDFLLTSGETALILAALCTLAASIISIPLAFS